MLESPLKKGEECKPGGAHSETSEGWLIFYFVTYFTTLFFIGKDLDVGKDQRQKKGRQQTMRWLDSIANSMDVNLSKLREIVEDRGAWHAVVHEVTKSQTQTTKTTNRFCFVCNSMTQNFQYRNVQYKHPKERFGIP